MAFLIIFLIWYNLHAKSNPKIYHGLRDKLSKIIVGLVFFSLFTSFIPSFLFGTMGVLLALLIGFSPFIFAGWIISKILGVFKPNKQEQYVQAKCNSSKGYATYTEFDKKRKKASSITGLTKSVPKRRKILDKFNKKYDLTLTDKEIDRIVDASYMSYGWEKEISDMQNEYSSINEWYSTDTCWLRAYIRAFAVQSISSDFEMQRQICLNSFEQIFYEINPESYANIDDCVDAINNRYLTFFDESSFMIAYRFLEANGKRFKLPHSNIYRNESDIDRLKRKYDEDVQNNVQTTPVYDPRRMM